jgi:TetR/AcrR family transcriptional regulator, cholesterol catabolism regulator
VKPDQRPARAAATSSISRRRNIAREGGSREYKARKDRILQAAAVRFKEDGFDRTDLADIAGDAGIERANIYYYVEGKDDLYVQVLLAVKGDVVQVAERIAKSSELAPERLRSLMVHLMSELDRHYPYLYLRYEQVIGSLTVRFPDNPQVRAISRLTNRHFAAFRLVVRDGMRDGTFVTDLSPGIVAEAAIGMVLQSKKWFDPAKSRYSGTHLGGALADILLQGLSAKSDQLQKGRPEE